METYFFSLLILGLIIVVKLGLILCLYAYRMRRTRLLRQMNENNIGGATAYPQPPYNQRSAILDYEETPAPISSVSSISVPAIPGEYVVQPPSYNEVVHSPDDKPPSYEQVICLSNRNT